MKNKGNANVDSKYFGTLIRISQNKNSLNKALYYYELNNYSMTFIEKNIFDIKSKMKFYFR